MRLIILFGLIVISTCQLVADDCNADARLSWARERMYPSATKAQLQQLLNWLIISSNSCSNNGDLFYYRSLVASKLGKRPDPSVKRRLEEYPPSDAARQFNPLEAPAPSQKRAPSPYVRQKWALLVGIQSFSDQNISPLHYAANDAVKLAEVLKGPGKFDPSHITLLTNSQATTTAIKTALGDIRARANEDDLVLVYISSHGLSGEYDATGVSFVITADTNISDVDHPGTRYATSLPMVELSDFSRMLKAQRFVLILDTCFGGGAIASSKTIVPLDTKPIDSFTGSLHGMESGSGRAVMAASSSTEKSWESQGFANGYFTHFLIEALQRHNGNDSINEIYAYVREKVSDAVEKDMHQRQTPVLDHTERGDEIILGVDVAKSTQAAR